MADNQATNEDGDDWEPEPASLRDGETTDESHASRNAAMLRIARDELGRDHDAENPGRTGEIGVPVDAVCTSCKIHRDEKRVRVKRADRDELPDDLDDAPGSTFEHVCHGCGTVVHWNVRAVLWGVIDDEGSDA